MRELTRRVGTRIFSINEYDYKAYICFMLIVLFSMVDHFITQVMVNCYGYVEGPFYERSTELIIESIILTFIKVAFGTMLAKALVDNPIKKEVRLTFLFCEVKTEEPRTLLTWLVIGMNLYFLATAIYDTANYMLIVLPKMN